MLISDMEIIGEKLRAVRKKRGLTQVEVAKAADLSDRTYIGIECGAVNPRLDSIIRICNVLRITPNDIVVENSESEPDFAETIAHFDTLSNEDRRAALALLKVFFDAVG